jgi:hypothetical protein
MELKSEFAHVRVELDESGNGPRLLVQDLKTARTLYLDPLELETLAWMCHEDLAPFLDPAHRRWRDDVLEDRDDLSGSQDPGPGLPFGRGWPGA